MAKALWDVLHGAAPSLGTRFGIEVEVEGMRGMHYRLDGDGPFNTGKYWRCTKDGSLRNYGVELVTRGGIQEVNLGAAIQELASDLAPSEDGAPSFSARTSTHVHVNIQDLSCLQVLALVVIAAGLEPLLQECIAPERRTNLFCIPLHMCSTMRSSLRSCYVNLDSGPRSAMEHLSTIGKYSSINTGRLYDLGTLEFRGMHGADDLEHLTAWCAVLSRVRALVYGVHSINDAVTVLLRPEHEMREYLFNGLNLKFKPGKPALSYKEAVASSLSVLSYMKEPTGNSAGVLRYADIADNIPLDRQEAVLSPGVWMGINRQQLRGFGLPPQATLVALASDPGMVGRTMYDCFVPALGEVVFWIVSQEGNNRYVGRYSQPPQQEDLPVHVLTFKVGA